MTIKFSTTIHATYGDTCIEMNVSVYDDGYIELDEAFAVQGGPTSLDKHYVDVTELLKTAYHRQTTKTTHNETGLVECRHKFMPLDRFLIDYHADQVSEDRAGAMMDKARADYEDHLAAE